MTPILTICLNPAVDLSSEAELVRPVRKIRTTNENYDPGGGGINVARTIMALGGEAEALFLAGGTIGVLLDDLVDRSGVPHHRFPIKGSTRMAYTVHERKTGLEYRFVPTGPTVEPAELEPCLDFLRAYDGHYVVASGSLPGGAPDDILAKMADIAASKGVRFILDSSGAGLRTTLDRSRVYLVKPSRGELEELVGHELDEPGIRAAALDLVKRGAAELIAVTMGAEGAFLASADGAIRVPAIHVAVCSAVGAGDSFLGAMTLALTEGRSGEDALRFGIAAGAAAVMMPGTTLCRRDDVLRLYGHLRDRPEAE